MKIKIIFAFLLILIIKMSLFSQEQNNYESERETREIALVTRIIKNSSTAEMNKVWPGYNLRSSPVIITFGNGHIYAFNLKSQSPHWKRTTHEGIEILYTGKDKWGVTSAPMLFNFEIEGQEAFVYRLDMMTKPAFMPFFVMVHERFHVYQMEHFASEHRNAESEYPESSNVDNLAMMQLEELILLDFLKALESSSHDDIIKSLKTFISVHKKRVRLLSPISQQWEDRQQMVEGLADYVAAKNLDTFGYFGEKMGQKHLLFVMKRYTSDDDITERALKWRHYGVGSSIGYALDYLNASGWKKQVEKDISLQSILEKQLAVNPQEADVLFQQASQQYNLSNLKMEVEKKINAYNNMLNNHMEEFQKQAGIILNVQSPPDTGLSAGGHSKGVYSLADGSMLSVLDTSKTSSTDGFWNLELRSISHLFQTNDGFRRFKVSSDNLEIVIDGQPHSLRQINQKTFRSLSIKGNSCHFKSTQNVGKITMRNNELTISFH